VKDTIEFRNGKAYHVQRVKKYTLQASDITVLETSSTEYDYVLVNKPLDSKMYNTTDGSIADNTALIIGYVEKENTNSSDFHYAFDLAIFSTTIIIGFPNGTYASLAEAQSSIAGTVIYYQLATPIETEIAVINNAFSYPNGTFYIEDVVRSSGVYNAGITVDKPILTLNEIYRLNDDGSSTKLAVSGATVAGNGLSFTHSSLSNGDFVWFDYFYQGTNVKGLSTIYYYGDKMIVSGSGTTSGKVYKIVPTVVDENIVWTKVEV
jgi:hypothetical protein